VNPDSQNVIVTGGASGIGRAMARHLAEQGSRVWALDIDAAAVEESRQNHGAQRLEYLCRDCASESTVVETVDQLEAESGGLTVLVNNAAVLKDQALVSKLGGKIRKHALKDWDATLRNNLTSTFLMAREVAGAMIRGKRRGLIVNISSISRNGNPGQSSYAASKAAIDALTVTWSQELALYGIRVTAIAPGFVETPMTDRIPPLFLDQIRQRTPLKRFGTLEEFQQAIQFVLRNDYLNGKILELDGGLRF
jgi:3-oxoacyl-[acyl-carrier protein] reductase